MSALYTQVLEQLSHTGMADTDPRFQAALLLCEDIDNQRYSFGHEPFHSFSDTDKWPTEYLLRHTSHEKASLAWALHSLREMNMIHFLDRILIPRAITHALTQGYGSLPVSVNVAAESIEDPTFRFEMKNYFDDLMLELDNPADIVLEVPVSSTTSNIALRWLKDIRNMGYRIAFDNFGQAGSPYDALTVVEPDFVKINGNFIESALKDAEPGLGSITERIRSLSPETKILAPWVGNVREASRLHSIYGIDAVQGRDLPRDRAYFKSQLDFLLYAE